MIENTLVQCYNPLLTLSSHTHRLLDTNAAATDLSGPAKPIQRLWRFICHSNVFLGKMPTLGEPGQSGQDTAVGLDNASPCVTPHQCGACVCAYKAEGMQYHKFMVIEMAQSFGENAVDLIPQQKRSPYSICTQWLMQCDRETPESKRSYRGLAGFTTYPQHKSYLLITK